MVIHVGRRTQFGNPIIIGHPCPVCSKVHTLVDYGPCYRKYLYARLSDNPQYNAWGIKIARTIRSMPIKDTFKQDVMALRHATLWCPGCDHASPTCHSRILEKAAWWLFDNQ